MAKFTLSTESTNKEVLLQLELDPPPLFDSIDDASDWALTNLPYGVFIKIYDGRKTLRAEGVNSLTLVTFDLKKRSDKGKERRICDCDKYDYCKIHGSMP